jgi:hypothetical protein
VPVSLDIFLPDDGMVAMMSFLHSFFSPEFDAFYKGFRKYQFFKLEDRAPAHTSTSLMHAMRL